MNTKALAITSLAFLMSAQSYVFAADDVSSQVTKPHFADQLIASNNVAGASDNKKTAPPSGNALSDDSDMNSSDMNSNDMNSNNGSSANDMNPNNGMTPGDISTPNSNNLDNNTTMGPPLVTENDNNPDTATGDDDY